MPQATDAVAPHARQRPRRTAEQPPRPAQWRFPNTFPRVAAGIAEASPSADTAERNPCAAALTTSPRGSFPVPGALQSPPEKFIPIRQPRRCVMPVKKAEQPEKKQRGQNFLHAGFSALPVCKLPPERHSGSNQRKAGKNQANFMINTAHGRRQFHTCRQADSQKGPAPRNGKEPPQHKPQTCKRAGKK